MKNLLKFTVLFLISLFFLTSIGEAKTSYYKSSSSGKFVTKSYAKYNKSTTYKSYFR